jgi:ABC-type uncharacterized transport system substrate-binding protein
VRRREFITLIGGAAAAWPIAARAQQAERVRRIGVLMAFSESDPEAQTWLTAFQEGLQRLGWGQGHNIRIDYRWAGADHDRLRTYAAELVGMASDVIIAGATPALAALHRETRTLPLVFEQVSDPVRLGFVASLAHPDSNITGFTNFEHAIGGKWLELLKDTAPGTIRAGVIFALDHPSQAAYLQAIETAAPSFGVHLTLADVGDAADIERAINEFAHEPKGALIVLPSDVSIVHRDLIILLAARYRMPAVYPYRFFTRGGGFISYGVDLVDQYRRAASYVDRILKGEKPADLPVQAPTKYELVINLKTAKALGLEVPPSLLARADEVIE